MKHRRLCLSLIFAVLATFARSGWPTRSEPPPTDAVVQRLTYTTTWIGNSFPGTVQPGLRNHKHVQINAEALFVAPDGTCYLNSTWDEDGYEAGIYRNGDIVGNCDDLHGWGRSGGKAICASNKYIYVAMSQRGDDGGNYPAKNQFGKFQYPPRDHIWRCVRRYDLKGNPAPFPGGSGHDGSMLIVEDLPMKNGLPDVESDAERDGVTGLAVSPALNRLYVCSPQPEPGFQTFNAETMAPVPMSLHTNRLPVSFRPRRITCGTRGDLWISGSGSYPGAEIAWPVLVHFAADGMPLSSLVGSDREMAGYLYALSLSVDEAHDRLFLVGDHDPDQQVQVFDTSKPTPRLVDRIGARGGIFAGPDVGRDGPLRFNLPIGAGSDRDGNLYIASAGAVSGGGMVLESYAPTTNHRWFERNWRLLGLEFVDGGDFDPATDGRDLYTKEEHFRLDLDKTSGKDSTYFGYTVNRAKYPNDPRRFTDPTTAFFRRINGKPVLFTTDMYIGPLTISRFDTTHATETAIPCGVVAKTPMAGNEESRPGGQPTTGGFIWRDRNGNGDLEAAEFSRTTGKVPTGWGWCVDSRGDIWQATDREGIRHFPVGGLDAHGSPIYTFATMQTLPMPAPLTELCRAEYVAETDTMFLTGYTTDHPHTGGEWGAVGTEVLRFDGWKTGNRTPSLRVPLLYDGKKQPQLFIKSLSVAGDYLFAAEGRDPERIFVYETHSGKLQGLLQPDATVGSHSGWIDHPYAIRAFRRKSGEYLVLAEEDLDAKLILYRWTPPK